jgi:hypothetical protein
VEERLVQMVSNQELGREDHVDGDEGELEDEATHRVYGLASTSSRSKVTKIRGIHQTRCVHLG